MNVYITTYNDEEEKAFSSMKKAQDHRDYRIAETISVLPPGSEHNIRHFAYGETRLEVTKQDGSKTTFVYRIKPLRVR